MQNPWTSVMPQDRTRALPTANKQLYVHNRISTPWSHIDQVHKKKEMLHNNEYMYDDKGAPITATIAPNNANIVSHFNNAYTGTSKSDRESIIDVNSTKRLTSVYEQPYLRGEKRELVTITRNDKQLPNTLQHESKYPHTGYHNTENHPEIRYSDTNAPSFKPPVAVSFSHSRKQSRLMNVRLNTYENPRLNRKIHIPDQLNDRNEMLYMESEEFPSNLPEPTRVQSESSLKDPQVFMSSDEAPSFGVRPQNQYTDELHNRQIHLNLKDDHAEIEHKVLQPAQRSMGNMGRVIHSQNLLSYKHMHKPDRSEHTQKQLRPNEILKDDDLQNLPPRMQMLGSKPGLKSKVSFAEEIETEPHPKFFQGNTKAPPVTADVALKEEDLLNMSMPLPQMSLQHSKKIEHHKYKDDMSHEMQSQSMLHHKKQARRDQAINSSKITDMKTPVAPQFQTKHGGDIGAWHSNKNNLDNAQPAMNFVGFIKGLFKGTKTHITKDSTKLNDPVKSNTKGSIHAPVTQDPQKITLDKLRLNSMEFQSQHPNRKDALQGITNKKEELFGRMPLGNRPN